MKTILLASLITCMSIAAQSQITNPVIRGSFGVDADLRANYFDGFVQAGNDDWFNNGTAGPGNFIIDTTGASYINKQYITNPATRMQPFFRGMRFPQFTVINNAMLIDAIFIRDHHGDDSTVFASGSNKNGMTPADWSTPVAQGIPDKNDILDMFMHVRRAGPNSTDSLWMFGGLSLDNTTGNRYFDFEMYQTDIYYDRSSLSFKGYGPDAGHTTWKFDATGHVLVAGDIIFTAEYSSSALTAIEARIWINKNDLTAVPNPAAFSWGGQFDGASSGATFGYASIRPKTAGSFFTGLQCSNNTWGGPFGIVLQDNSLATTYDAKQFMEFSVNLSKLGLDPLVNVGDPCKMPFRRILVKSRASTSFTAELKDFVGPFSFFRAPELSAIADIPYFCGVSDIGTISIDHPLVTSLYVWSTPDGNIMGDNIGPEIQVSEPGTYIVAQQLMDSCGSSWAMDTVVLQHNDSCIILATKLLSFTGNLNEHSVLLNWSINNNQDALYFQIERSTDNINYTSLSKQPGSDKPGTENYNGEDPLDKTNSPVLFYRLKIVEKNGHIIYSRTIAINRTKNLDAGFSIMPNPVKSEYALLLKTNKSQEVSVAIYDARGELVQTFKTSVAKGATLLPMSNPAWRLKGIYIIRVNMDEKIYTEKMVYTK
jgi:hypothetical protein